MTATEYVVLVDDHDREIGTAEKLSAHKNNLLHRAFSVFIFSNTPERQLLIQQRALSKYHSPGLWTNTCCSHPRQGEAVLTAGERRLLEEMGIVANLQEMGWFHYNAHFSNGLSENEIDHVLVGFVPLDTTISPDPAEAHAYRWIDLVTLQAELAQEPERFTPWFAQALNLALQSNKSA